MAPSQKTLTDPSVDAAAQLIFEHVRESYNTNQFPLPSMFELVQIARDDLQLSKSQANAAILVKLTGKYGLVLQQMGYKITSSSIQTPGMYDFEKAKLRYRVIR